MDLAELTPYFVNGGVALVVIFLIVIKRLVPGWAHEERMEEIAELKIALEHERETADKAMSAAQATKDVLLSLRGRYRDDDGS